jgi:predicted ArsR family transcriptional regulator
MKQGVQNALYEDKIYRIIYVRCENNEILKEKKMNVTKQSRVLEALQSGEQLTAKQIAARFGVKNPTATISDIRLSGFAVYANQHTDTKGRVTTKYRLGTPSRELIAAGYRAMSLGIAV